MAMIGYTYNMAYIQSDDCPWLHPPGRKGLLFYDMDTVSS
jgi:hypothetical protein